MDIKSKIKGKLKGRVSIAFIHGSALRNIKRNWIDLGPNEITDMSEDIIQGLMARDLENKMLAYIGIGDGGDLDAVLHNDTGARVAPVSTETEIRSLVESVPIMLTNQVGDDITYTALARPEQANSDDINEFALLSNDGSMFAHFVTEEVAPLGRATKYPKKSWHYVAVRWTITYTNA